MTQSCELGALCEHCGVINQPEHCPEQTNTQWRLGAENHTALNDAGPTSAYRPSDEPLYTKDA